MATYTVNGRKVEFNNQAAYDAAMSGAGPGGSKPSSSSSSSSSSRPSSSSTPSYSAPATPSYSAPSYSASTAPLTYNGLLTQGMGYSNDTKAIQQFLNDNYGANLTVDGYYGAKTAEAIANAQRQLGITADGKAGQQTYNALNQAFQAPSAPATAPVAAPKYEYDDDYSDRDAAYDILKNTANSILNNINSKPEPTPYVDRYESTVQSILDTILKGDNWKATDDEGYNNLYGHYTEMYSNNADKAMRNTMGAAAALTGGYGNSYAETVAQQAYDNQMDNLNAAQMDLYKMAYGMNQDRQQNEYDKLAAVEKLREADRDMWERDNATWANDQEAALSAVNKLIEAYDSKTASEYDNYKDALSLAERYANAGYEVPASIASVVGEPSYVQPTQYVPSGTTNTIDKNNGYYQTALNMYNRGGAQEAKNWLDNALKAGHISESDYVAIWDALRKSNG